MTGQQPGDKRASHWRWMMPRAWWMRLGACVVLVVAVLLALRAMGVDVAHLTPGRVRNFVLSFGIWAPLAYILLYSQPLIPLPASIVIMAAGLVFGPVWGVAAALVSSMIRACTQFALARLLGREAVSKLLRGNVASLNQHIGAQGFQIVVLMRLISFLPFDVQNYGLGLSAVRFGPYALATFLSMIPMSVLYVYLGYSLTDQGNIWKVLFALTLITAPLLVRQLYVSRRKLVGLSGEK